MPTNAKYLTALHKNIDQYFSFSEVRTLCFEMGIDYENIAGETRTVFIRNLLISLAKQKRLQELVDKVNLERPFLNMPAVPTDFQLPVSIAQSDMKTVIQHIYGNQYNIGGDAHIGDKIDTGGGDFVGRDKVVQGDEVHGDKVGGDKVEGDKISVGNISGGQGIAIGSDASAQYQSTGTEDKLDPQIKDSGLLAANMNTAVQEAVEQVRFYIKRALRMNPPLGTLLAESVGIILSVAQAIPVDQNHLALLLLGQKQLAGQLADSVPGIEQVVEEFETAVTHQ